MSRFFSTILLLIPSISFSNGAELFSIHCSGCHASIEIQSNWSELSEDDFLSITSETMPPDAAGSLEEDEYLAIKDYIFDLKYSGSKVLTKSSADIKLPLDFAIFSPSRVKNP